VGPNTCHPFSQLTRTLHDDRRVLRSFSESGGMRDDPAASNRFAKVWNTLGTVGVRRKHWGPHVPVVGAGDRTVWQRRPHDASILTFTSAPRQPRSGFMVMEMLIYPTSPAPQHRRRITVHEVTNTLKRPTAFAQADNATPFKLV